MPRLNKDEIMTIRVLKQKGESNCSIARTLGVTEGAVRYHARRAAEDAVDGRANRPMAADSAAAQIAEWMAFYGGGDGRLRDLDVLLGWLRTEHGWTGSKSALWRFVAKHYGRPARRPFRRVETPPGVQAQVDWMEEREVLVAGERETIYGFVMTLSHSRRAAVVWCRSMNQTSWHHAHNEAFKRLGGIPAVVRIDNLKTGVSKGAGAWGEVNKSYASYAREVGFHVDPCPVRHPEAKGKVETRITRVRRMLSMKTTSFDSLDELQQCTDEAMDRHACQCVCPATGQSVHETWLRELDALAPLPLLPEPFDVCVTRPVHKDCTVHFEGRSYSVPFYLAWKRVEVRGCAATVQFLHEGKIVAEHPRHTPQRILINDAHFEGEATADRLPPLPLGKVGQAIREITLQSVEIRAADYYAQLAGVLS